MYTQIDSKIVIKYLITLKEKSGLTYEAIAEASGVPESTIKRLFSGKVENPGLDNILPIMYVLGGSFEEISGKSKDEVKEFSISSIKEMYEFQTAEMAKLNETHINNIRAHYEQHREDVTQNYEMRLADKREIIKEKDEHIKTLKKENLISKILAGVGYGILICLLILEVANPNLGWIQF